MKNINLEYYKYLLDYMFNIIPQVGYDYIDSYMNDYEYVISVMLFFNLYIYNEDDNISTKIKNVVKSITRKNNKRIDYEGYIDYKLSSMKLDFYKWLFE